MTTKRRFVPTAWHSTLAITDAGTLPRAGLVGEVCEQPLFLAGAFILGDRPVEQGLRHRLQSLVGAEAEGVRQAVFLADFVHPRHAEAAVAADVDREVVAGSSQPIDHELQVIIRAVRGVHRAGPQGGVEHVLRGRLADHDREVLVLLVVAVEQRQLLLSVRRVVGGVEIERETFGQLTFVLFTQPFDPGRGQEVQRPPERARS